MYKRHPTTTTPPAAPTSEDLPAVTVTRAEISATISRDDLTLDNTLTAEERRYAERRLAGMLRNLIAANIGRLASIAITEAQSH